MECNQDGYGPRTFIGDAGGTLNDEPIIYKGIEIVEAEQVGHHLRTYTLRKRAVVLGKYRPARRARNRTDDAEAESLHG